MTSAGNLIAELLHLYVLVIVLRVVVGYFPTSPGGFLAKATYFLHRATEPILQPVRRILPRVGSGPVALDFSPLLVIFLIQFILIPIFRA